MCAFSVIATSRGRCFRLLGLLNCPWNNLKLICYSVALGPSDDESMLKCKSIPFMLKRLTIQTDYGWTIYDNTTLIHKRKLSPQISQDLNSENQLPYCFNPASNLRRTRENQICFQTNQIRSLTPTEPASGFSMTPTSNQSI